MLQLKARLEEGDGANRALTRERDEATQRYHRLESHLKQQIRSSSLLRNGEVCVCVCVSYSVDTIYSKGMMGDGCEGVKGVASFPHPTS